MVGSPWVMEAAAIWGERWSSATNSMAKEYMEVACRKQSLVCLAADRSTMAGLFELIEAVGPHIAALKTHVDLVDDWTPDAWASFCTSAKKADLLIFEDRKFADIGGISRKQMAGVYNIRAWSDLVTAHLISGPDIVDGLQAGWGDVGRVGGVLLLAQMSSRGNLLNPSYTAEVVSKGKAHHGVFGFIGNGSRPTELAALRAAVGDAKMIWTPGVNLAVGDGEMGQRYGHPMEAVMAGSDCIIVGSGIHKADDPTAAAKAYADASWNGLVQR
ncbi:MAG: orotidine-5'-phosphate decarboxylase [Candidatus Poseidonia sp.]|uniref:orotidine-5'-phosphate decarboxylase n=2 Tax=Poseidonia sp. TaxID=2666344 RepID=UPI0030C5898A|nr:orotidine-5'-phosphate decarboxylase [Poseidonia sp.]